MLFFVLLRLLMIVFLMTQLYPWGILLSLLENLAKENPLAFGFASKSWVLHMCTRRKGGGSLPSPLLTDH
jgi:hypothetical protein